MTVQELSQYTYLTARYEIAEKLLHSLQEAVHAGSQVIADMPNSASVKDWIGNLEIEINDLKARIEYLKREIKRERGGRLNEFIERIDNESLKAIFRLKRKENIILCTSLKFWSNTKRLTQATYWKP